MGRRKKRRLFDDSGIEVKVCTRCNKTHSIDMFRNNPSWCLTCQSEYNKHYQSQKKHTIEDKAKERARSAVYRSAEKGINCMSEDELEAEIKRMYYLQSNQCLYTGLNMELSSKDNKFSVSVDRYRAGAESGTYYANNLALVCSIINRMKQELSYKEFLFLCRKVVTHYDNLKEKGIDLCDF
jgi:CRISPR/Cas system Type II protein with McrA/HNH and RuvC-like nuclease domain